MAPINPNGFGHDHRYVGYWTRMFSSPKCPHCEQRMKWVEYPYGLVWECGPCDWTTFHTPEERVGLWKRFVKWLDEGPGPTDNNV
jgi:hypothetical protein